VTKVAIIATMELTPGTRDEYPVELLAHRRRNMEGEPGTHAFEVLLPNDKPDTIMLYEVYADQAALDQGCSLHASTKACAASKWVASSPSGAPLRINTPTPSVNVTSNATNVGT